MNESTLTGDAVRAHCARHGIAAVDMAKAIGLSPKSGRDILKGVQWKAGVPVDRHAAVAAFMAEQAVSSELESGLETAEPSFEEHKQGINSPLSLGAVRANGRRKRRGIQLNAAVQKSGQADHDHAVDPDHDHVTDHAIDAAAADPDQIELVGDTMFRFSIAAKHGGIMTKRLSLDDAGELVKDSGDCWLARGVIGTEIGTLRDFAEEILPELRPNEAVVMTNRDFGESTDLVKADAARAGAVTRTRTDMQFEAGPGLMLLDADPSAEYTAASAEAWLADLDAFMPGVSRCARVTTHSASSWVSTAAGEPVTQAGGLHVFAPIKDASVLAEPGADKQLRDRVLARAWLAGHGQLFIDRTGRAHARCILDVSVWQAERLAFEAAPVLAEGLVQTAPYRPIKTGSGSAWAHSWSR